MRDFAGRKAEENGHELDWMHVHEGLLIGRCETCGATVRVYIETMPEQFATHHGDFTTRYKGKIMSRHGTPSQGPHLWLIAEGEALAGACPTRRPDYDRRLR